jgi:O-antigen ligase
LSKPVEIQKTDFRWPAAVFIVCITASILFDIGFLAFIPFMVIIVAAAWQQPNITFLVLVLSIPFSVEYNFTPALGTDIPDEALMLLVTFLFAAKCIYHPASIDRRALMHPLVIILLVHLVWITVTLIFSTDRLLSLKYLLAKCWYVGAFIMAPLVIFREKKWIRAAAVMIGIGMLIVALIALFRHYQLGFSFATVNESVAPFFRNHVNYSSLLVCTIPLFVACYALADDKNVRSLILLCLAIMLIALFFAFARGAWLALVAGVAAWWLIRWKWLVKAYLIGISITIIAALWLKSNDKYLDYAHDYRTTIFHENFSQHLVATYKLKDVSTAERFYRWIAGARMAAEQPLTGFGPNTFYNNYKPYAIPAFRTWVSDNPEHSTVHNYFLLLLIEQGVPGLIIFLLLGGVLLFYAQHLYHLVRERFYRICCITIGVITIMIMTLNFLSDLIETDKIGGLFFLCISALVMTDLNSRNTSQPAPDIQRIS